MQQLIVVNHPSQWSIQIPGVQVISAKEYLSGPQYSDMRKAKVYNLCKSYRYQSSGYYVSLLAEARGHKPIPNVMAIQDIKSQAMVRIVSDELQQLIQKSLVPIQSDHFTLSIYFGRNLAKRYEKLSQRLFTHFQAPFLRGEFIKKGDDWILRSIQPISSNDIPDSHVDFVVTSAQDFFKKRPLQIPKKSSRYDLAILVNPAEQLPPSNSAAIQKFMKAGLQSGFHTELITKDDFSRINEFDALFIRETTGVNHHTYRFARKAAAEGLVVIDDPDSILKCTNKVYLSELLNRHSVPAPETVIIHSENAHSAPQILGYPVIIKQPDSSFSNGVVKADNAEEFKEMCKILFEKSDMLVCQQFLYTEFDWRVGVLNGAPIYVCKYFMARKHWQIYERSPDGKTYEGRAETLPMDEVPQELLSTALKAASLMGNGLYGVDLKETGNQAYVIEVNDNPSIDAGCEDLLLKDELYQLIMNEIMARVEKLKERKHP